MRVGLIARADSRGLGIQTKAFYDRMEPCKTLVVDCPSAQPLPVRRDWYPNGSWTTGIPSMPDIESFLEDVDVVYTAETGYTPALWDIAEKRGIRTVLHANWEFLNPADRPTQWLAPSLWCIDQWPEDTVHIPFPVEVDKFPDVAMPDLPTNLLHIVGRPTFGHDGMDLHRNGTIDLLRALVHVTTDVTVTIRCQQPGHVEALIAGYGIELNHNINLVIDAKDTENYWDNYTGQHALILPRRFGGLSLPANEAIGAGMPVIMTDIDPNNRWLPKDWLVPAVHIGMYQSKQLYDMHAARPVSLALKLQRLTSDEQFYRQCVQKAQQLRWQLSWTNLKPLYEDILHG